MKLLRFTALAIALDFDLEVLARCELIGRRIQQLNPQITISFDAKHPTEWEKSACCASS